VRDRYFYLIQLDWRADQQHSAEQLLSVVRKEFPHGIQDTEPEVVGRALMRSLGDKSATSDTLHATSSDDATAIGETLQKLDERVRRQQFYWALSTPKVDSGIKWNIQDFNDPDYRGPAHWTSVVFDDSKFAPRETGYAFMTDEAGYTLDPRSAQVRQYSQDNDYYRGSAATAYSAASLLLGFREVEKAIAHEPS